MPKDKKLYNEEDEVLLTGNLSEFRIALLQEIEAATRSASNTAVSLINGRKIAQVGGSYQYVFDVENALNLPGDTPGDLYIPGRNPIEVVVISIEGMVITLSIPENFGKFIPSARLQSNLAFLMRKLIERIESKANISNPIGDRILGDFINEKPYKSEISDNDLNKQQRIAVASSLNRNITFIWGPPGTGKTWTIGSIAKELYLSDRTVLLVSHTNTAVDGAIKIIGKFIDGEQLAEGKVIRVGDPKGDTLDENLLLSTHVERRSAELAERKQKLETELADLITKAKETSKTLDICEWVMEAQEDISSMEKELNILDTINENLKGLREELRKHESQTDHWNESAKAAEIAQGHSVKIFRSEELIKKLESEKTFVAKKLKDILDQSLKAELLLREVEKLGWVTRKWRRLPSPEEQLAIVEGLKEELRKLDFELNEINIKLEKANSRLSHLKSLFESFRDKYQAEPEEILRLAKEHQMVIDNLRQQVKLIFKEYGAKATELKSLFEERLVVLIELGLVTEKADNLDDILKAIKNVFNQAYSMVKDVEVEQLRIEKKELNSQIQTTEAELKGIIEALKIVEDLVIKDASIVATTLTRAYLKDSIQACRFDTVILDEASMAPIPALWIAASVAEKNAVVVGDWKQLPPIVLSTHALSIKWLGQDIFEVVGLTDNFQHSYLIGLKRQYRMHPDISSIPNELIYQGMLEDDDSTTNLDELENWYRVGWEHDTPVLLIDTSSVGAWVTSVARGRSSSRLNFLSATICVDIVEHILDENRDILQEGKPPRVLIACPYRPHAQLLELLIREHKLDNEVIAGTTHSFQGSEAEVVIFDLVNDKTHWRVAMFMPSFDINMQKLLNVALTRARRRLIIIGNFEYISKHSSKAFVGAKLLPFLLNRFPKVDALDIVKTGLAARAAKAQSEVLGGDIEESNKRIVVTQEHFFRYLRSDFAHSRFRIVIYSPFITENRVAQLEPPIRAAIERGVSVYIVTKPHCDRSKREIQQYQMLENTLTDWGAIVVHKKGMHEKLVFIDYCILWNGSLNPLSFINTQEHMERRVSKNVFSDYAKTLRLNDLIEGYNNGVPKCPICTSEIVASEGRDDPFYWRCVNEECDYTRSIDQPPIQGGIINCNRCSGKVEYGEWGGRPAWRCLENRRHHQKIARTHLRLPKMRAIVPKRYLTKLDRNFNIIFVKPDNKKKKNMISSTCLSSWM
ncbi:MAG: DEAD/DEAH box helicase family protein [Ignavibacteria bacterium]|nr:DEAD/DEAH box helicase family protein [Ignavibacteria bacterium]